MGKLNNPTFNCAEFDIIKSQAGLNSYRLSAKEWMQKTNAIGIVAKAGRYEGTYAHKDIVFEIDLLVEHGELECRIHRARHTAGRTTYQTQSNSDSSNENIGEWQ